MKIPTDTQQDRAPEKKHSDHSHVGHLYCRSSPCWEGPKRCHAAARSSESYPASGGREGGEMLSTSLRMRIHREGSGKKQRAKAGTGEGYTECPGAGCAQDRGTPRFHSLLDGQTAHKEGSFLLKLKNYYSKRKSYLWVNTCWWEPIFSTDKTCTPGVTKSNKLHTKWPDDKTRLPTTNSWY